MTGTVAPFTSPLKTGWVGFTAEEAEIFKGNIRLVYKLLICLLVFSVCLGFALR